MKYNEYDSSVGIISKFMSEYGVYALWTEPIVNSFQANLSLLIDQYFSFLHSSSDLNRTRSQALNSTALLSSVDHTSSSILSLILYLVSCHNILFHLPPLTILVILNSLGRSSRIDSNHILTHFIFSFDLNRTISQALNSVQVIIISMKK